MSPGKSLLTMANNKFNKIFNNIVLIHQNKYSIKALLNSNVKDHIPPEKKSGKDCVCT